MQLILNTETTADIKTKMSLKEDKFEKCVTEIISIVTNGDLSNGDFSNKNNEAGDNVKGEKNQLMLETLETEIVTADNELKQVENDAKMGHTDIKAPEKKDLDQHQTDKIQDENEKETNKHQKTTALPNYDKENEISEKNVTSKEQVEEDDTLLILSDSDLNICNSGDNIDMNACESVVVEKKISENANREDPCESLVVERNISENTNSEDACESVDVEKKNSENASNEVTECDDGINFDKRSSEDSEKVHTDLATFDRNTKICGMSKSADAIFASVVEEQNETAIDKNATEFRNDNDSEGASLDLSNEAVDTEPVENKSETDLNDSGDIMEDDIIEDDIIITMDRNGTVDDITKNNLIEGTAHINECEDETIPKELTASSNEILSKYEKNITGDDRIVDCPEDKMETNSCKETDEKQDANQRENTENKCDHEVTDKMDISEKSTSIDFDSVAVDNGSGDNTQCLHEVSNITDNIENNTFIKVGCVSENLVHSMNVDDEAGKISKKEETEINLRASLVKSPSNFNGSDDRTITIDCSTIEPATAREKDTETLVSGVSDDVIFSVDDDDKEKSTKLSDVNEVESNKVIVDDDKNNCDVDDGKVTENFIKPVTEVPKHSDDIIDLDETVSKSLKSISKTPDQDIGDNTTEKISEEFNPLVQSDGIIDLNKAVNSLITSESKTSIQNSNERQDDATDTISGVVPPVLKLSNTLDILSDEEEESKESNMDNKCINIEDDDDIMLIDDDTSGNETKTEQIKEKESEIEKQVEIQAQTPIESMEICKEVEKDELTSVHEEGQASTETENVAAIQMPEVNDKIESKTDSETKKPLLHEKFLKTYKKNLADMTREELEEYCVLKIVESILDRSNLSEIRTKLKTMSQNIDEYKKKAMMLTKQNRDLQVVLKSIQEDQKKGTESIVPLKITRSVGMQVLMGDKTVPRRKPVVPPAMNKPRTPVPQGPRPQKPVTPQKSAIPQIPVPRLVPANNPTLKSPTAQQTNPGKIASPVPNGIKTPPAQKGEKRSHNRIQSVTVDLTDDEPPAKVMNRAVPVVPPVVPPVRLVPSQNLLAPPRQPVVNSSPRKVYIPISGPQGQNVRPGQTIMLKTVPNQGPRQRCPPPHMVRMPQTMRMPRPQGMRHPAPLPDCVKQYQPPNWKALPPAPDLKLAKVENGIVISWKIEGYQEDSYEEIASYQLYAYQETSSPPSTALWKKIGDVKALPLPMACTLTQFMAGYKYYFAVRALDIRSRLGPFSLPGSILLLNKM